MAASSAKTMPFMRWTTTGLFIALLVLVADRCWLAYIGCGTTGSSGRAFGLCGYLCGPPEMGIRTHR
jgi:hypothetical protein